MKTVRQSLRTMTEVFGGLIHNTMLTCTLGAEGKEEACNQDRFGGFLDWMLAHLAEPEELAAGMKLRMQPQQLRMLMQIAASDPSLLAVLGLRREVCAPAAESLMAMAYDIFAICMSFVNVKVYASILPSSDPHLWRSPCMSCHGQDLLADVQRSQQAEAMRARPAAEKAAADRVLWEEWCAPMETMYPRLILWHLSVGLLCNPELASIMWLYALQA